MTENEETWFKNWFNEDYLNLYSYRDQEEAERHVDFLIRAMGLSGSEKILDLGCGAGRHSLALCKRGYSVVGVDASEYLIDSARELVQDRPNCPVRFVRANILQMGDQGLFDVAISMFTSFGYYEEDEENARLFGVVRNHLQRGGKFFFDYLHPSGVKRSLVPSQTIEVRGEPVTIEKELAGDIIHKKIHFPDRDYEEKIKLYSRDQVEDMLAEYRLEVVDCWNDFEGNPWKEEGDRQIFFCKAL